MVQWDEHAVDLLGSSKHSVSHHETAEVAPRYDAKRQLLTCGGVHDRSVKEETAKNLLAEVDFIVPSKAWEGRMRCKEANLKPFVGTLWVESPSGSA